MAIDTRCPHCSTAYRLKDELAGKRVTCKNPDCRRGFTVGGEPAANGTHAQPTKVSGGSKPAPALRSAQPAAPAVDTDALAASLFAEPTGEVVPEDKRVVAVTCPSCDNRWDVPWAMQGKNVLCPECRFRLKVPEQKVAKAADWRDPNAGGPSLRKIEKLEGVVASSETRGPSGASLKQAGVFEDNVEPRPRWHYAVAGSVVLLAVGLTALGVAAYLGGKRDDKQNRYMDEAVAEATEARDTPLSPAEAPLFRAGVQILAGEYLVRLNDPKRLQEAVAAFAKARQELDAAPPSTDRDLLFGELAVAQIQLGGDKEQVDATTRLPWEPARARDARARAEGKVYSVFGELSDTFKQMRGDAKPVAFEARVLALRRVTRELAGRGQPDLTARLLTGTTFLPAELPDVKAQVALEALKAGGDPAKVREAAQELVSTAAAGGDGPPPSAYALWLALDPPVDGAPKPPPLPKGGAVDDGLRLAYVTADLIQNKPAEALELATRPGRPDARLRALAQIAEWATDPGPAVQAAAEVVTGGGYKGPPTNDLILVRLARQAGRAALPDKADVFAKVIQKDDARAWARAEALRAQFAAAASPQPADAASVTPPENAKDFRIGHAWGRMAVVRNNVRLTGDAKPLLPDVDVLPAGTLRPYGKAGLALGLQDRTAK